MVDLNLQELEKAAEAYEELLVPGIFQAWTERVLDSARVRPGDRVLDVACGTGVLARAAATRVGPDGSVDGMDVNPAMLAVARRLAPHVAWRQGIAESLPYDGQSFDAVVSQFGLMFFTDRRAALQEMVRVLTPGGRLAVAVFDSLERIAAYARMVTLLERDISQQAADALRLPFVLGDTAELAALFNKAGGASPNIATTVGKVRFPTIRAMVEGDVRGWFPLAGIVLDEPRLNRLVSEAELDLDSFVAADGSVEFPITVHVVTATKS